MYDEVVKLDEVLDAVWSCKCSAMNILEETSPSDTRSYSEREESIEKCMQCDYDAEQAKYRKNPRFESLKEDMGQAKAVMDEEKRKEEYLAAFNASGINITSEPEFEASKVFVPMGPHDMSFLIRTHGEMTIENHTTLLYAGSGKTYHSNNYTIYNFNMPPNLDISIAQFTGPTTYEPEDPFDEYEAATKNHFDIYSDESIKIDGTNGREIISYNTKKSSSRDRYIVSYQLDKNTFVQIRSQMDFDRDFALLLESIHIAKKK